MMKKHFLFGFAFVVHSVLHAQNVYNIDMLIKKSLSNSPDIKISIENFETSKLRYSTSKSAYLPKVDLKGEVGVLGQKNKLLNNTYTSDTLLKGSLSLQQLIYDFGKTGGTTQSAKYTSKAFLMQNQQNISDKIREVKEAYYNVLKAKSLIDVQKENVKLNEAQLYRARKYFAAGIRTKIDVSDAKVSLIRSKISLNKAQYTLEVRYASLDKSIGFTQSRRDYVVNFEELDTTTLASGVQNYDLSLAESIQFAYEKRPSLQQYRHEIESQKAKIETIDSEYYPQVYFNANYTKQDLDQLLQILPEDSWQTNIAFSWNLYAGSSTTYKKQEQQINADIATNKLLLQKLLIKKDVTYAYINLSQKKDEVELSQLLLDVSEEKFEQASKRYENGLADYIELQQARQGYIDAKANLVITYFDYYIAVARLDNAIGR